jgi:hypothetical protein
MMALPLHLTYGQCYSQLTEPGLHHGMLKMPPQMDLEGN